MATQVCACGFLGDPVRPCSCGLPQIQKYRSRISGPLLDRLDIQVEVRPVAYRDLAETGGDESSEVVRARVDRARALQLARFRGRAIFCNAQMSARDLRRYCATEPAAEALLEQAMTKLALSARAYTRILKVARTIADLDASEPLRPTHIAEAIQYRSLDRAMH
jgi:magnesium chelatase family protein